MKWSEYYAWIAITFAGFGIFIGVGVIIWAYEYVCESPMIFITTMLIGIATVIFGTLSIKEEIKESKKENEDA